MTEKAYLTYKVRMLPTRKQYARLQVCLDHTRALYNSALEERIDCYRKTGKTITFAQQSRSLTEIRGDCSTSSSIPRCIDVWPLQQLDRSYKAMFTRHKKGARGRAIGFPKFRGFEHWSTLGTSSSRDCKISPRGLTWRGLFGGTMRLALHRPLPSWGRCKSFTMTRDGRRWFVHLVYEVDAKPISRSAKRPVGIDVGLKIAVMRSDGVALDMRQSFSESAAEFRREQRALSRCKKRSKRRSKVKSRIRRLHAKVVRRRRHEAHRITARLVRHFDGVAVEDLNLKGLKRMGGKNARGRGMRRKWAEFAPGDLISKLEWKCRRDGRPFHKVDARGTTIDCSGCGEAVPKTLRDRTHDCPSCGLVMDRDHNAAINIMNRVEWNPADVNPGVRLRSVRDCPRNTSHVATGHGDESPAMANAVAPSPRGLPAEAAYYDMAYHDVGCPPRYREQHYGPFGNVLPFWSRHIVDSDCVLDAPVDRRAW